MINSKQEKSQSSNCIILFLLQLSVNDQQKEKREELRSVIAEHGEAHNAQHIVTVSKQTRKGYEVKPSTFEKFNIAER